jgi:alpha-tubulin suppressor-like RCC1 family protein
MMASTSKWRASTECTALVAAALLSACFRPTVVDCKVGCGTGNTCPSGMTCSDGMCTRGPVCSMRLAAGEVHSCALRAGQIQCWGGNRFGQLGVGDTEDRGTSIDDMGENLLPVKLGEGRSAMAVAAGGRHTCALLDQGQVKCWGDNSVGQLGLGDRRPRFTAGDLGDNLSFVDLGSGLRATAIAAGLWHTCAVLDQGKLKCWGDNRVGQLGLGDTRNRGDDAGEMGDNLPAVDLGVPGYATQVAPGAYHTCALLGTGDVKCWGNNEHGQTGTDWFGGAPWDVGDARPPVVVGRKVASIAAGAFHTCALFDEPRDVKCWGLNHAGQLGLGMGTSKIGVGAFDLTTLPVVDLGAGRTAQDLALGASHTCAALDSGQVRCWGYNFDGELGIGSTANRGRAAGEMGDALPPTGILGAARAIAAGANHACAVVAMRVFCWGLNTHGQLGVGDDKNHGDRSEPLSPVDLRL